VPQRGCLLHAIYKFDCCVVQTMWSSEQPVASCIGCLSSPSQIQVGVCYTAASSGHLSSAYHLVTDSQSLDQETHGHILSPCLGELRLR
jgi:hypothetical protein